MPDPRLDTLAGVAARVEGVACWLARQATRAAVAGGVAGFVLWWALAGDRVDEWWEGTAGSVLVGLVALAPAAWLLNVRSALTDLVDLPDHLGGVARRRLATRGPFDRPDGGLLGAVRSIRRVVRDYGDVAGSWGAVAQLVVPSFWLLTLAAFAAVPVLVLLAAVAALAVSL